MKIIKKIIKTILNIIIIFFVIGVIAVIYNLFQVSILKKDYANFFGYAIFEISTGSMSGTMEINDVIIVKITKDVHTNDVITFNKDGEIITHRIINEEGDNLLTKGDANNGEDAPIERNMVIGKVDRVLSKWGIWLKVLSDSKVISCIIITLVFFGLAITDDNIENENNKKRKRNHFSRLLRNMRGIKSNEKEKKED